MTPALSSFGQHTFIRFTEQYADFALLQCLNHFFQGLDAGDVHERHAVQTDDRRARDRCGW